MVDRIKAAVDAKTDDSFVIMARTDALASEGLEAAIERANACVEAGADMIFPEAMKSEKEFELGEIKVPCNFTIQPGETKEVPFIVPFALVKSNAESLAEKGGALGTLGKLGKFANNEKSSYFVDAEADVKAAALDPSDKKEIKLV